MSITTAVIWGIFGAVLAEVLKQRQKWEALSEAKFRAQFRSLKFWAIFLVLVACGGAASYFLFEDSVGKLSGKSCFAAGAGAQALIRTMAAAATASKKRRMGFREADSLVEEQSSWRDILS